MRKFLAIIGLLIICSNQLSGQFNPCSWNFRKRITFDPTKVIGSTDLTDFPALITFTADANLKTTSNGGHVQNSNGYDIVFTAEDGVTKLDHELNGYSPTTGSLTAWVKIPVLSTSIKTYIYMYYGNSSITTNQSTSNTWSNGYVGVWHFDNSLNNTTSVSGLNGTNLGTSNSTTAKFNQSRDFDQGSSEYIHVTPFNSAYNLTSAITVSGWLRLTAVNRDQKIAGTQDDVSGGWKFGVFSDNKLEFEIRNSSNSPFLSRSASGGTALSINTWYYVVGQYSDAGDAIITYLNGNVDRNLGTTASCAPSAGTMKIGREPFANTAYLDGQLDELRLSNVVRSADWIATEYQNQNSPSTFYSISSEPKIWDGSSNTSWNTGSNWSGNTTPASGQDVIIASAPRYPTLNSSPSIGAMWIQPGASLNGGASSRTITIAFDILNCGTLTGASGHVRLNTNTIQAQHLSGTGTYSFNHLIINNQFSVEPSIVLNTPVTVGGNLSLLSGIVNTSSSNILHLTNNASSTSGSSQSFVSGPMSKAGNTDFVFPVGKGQVWRRISIKGISSSSTFRAEYFTNPYVNTTSVTSPLTNVSKIEYWQLDRTAGSGNARVGLYWENAAYSVINNCSDLTVARFNGTSWVEHPANADPGSSCTGSGTGAVTTTAVVTNFSPFTFGSKSFMVNALPLELISFDGKCEPGNIKLQWVTSNERNTSHFEIEHSTDGANFTRIGTVAANGYKKARTSYDYTDKTRFKGVVYYRMKMVDADDTYEYSRNIAVVCEEGAEISVIPNPNNGHFRITGIPVNSTYRVLNASGQIVLSGISQGETTLHILNPGIYFLQVPGIATPVKILVQ